MDDAEPRPDRRGLFFTNTFRYLNIEQFRGTLAHQGNVLAPLIAEFWSEHFQPSRRYQSQGEALDVVLFALMVANVEERGTAVLPHAQKWAIKTLANVERQAKQLLRLKIGLDADLQAMRKGYRHSESVGGLDRAWPKLNPDQEIEEVARSAAAAKKAFAQVKAAKTRDMNVVIREAVLTWIDLSGQRPTTTLNVTVSLPSARFIKAALDEAGYKCGAPPLKKIKNIVDQLTDRDVLEILQQGYYEKRSKYQLMLGWMEAPGRRGGRDISAM